MKILADAVVGVFLLVALASSIIGGAVALVIHLTS